MIWERLTRAYWPSYRRPGELAPTHFQNTLPAVYEPEPDAAELKANLADEIADITQRQVLERELAARDAQLEAQPLPARMEAATAVAHQVATLDDFRRQVIEPAIDAWAAAESEAAEFTPAQWERIGRQPGVDIDAVHRRPEGKGMRVGKAR
jgi:hypothetical protein